MDQHNEQIQRALNEQKRRELQERFGAMRTWSDASLPPEVEGEWLDEVLEFERMAEGAGMTTVRAFVGAPDIRPLGEVPPGELRAEVQSLLDVLGEHNVMVCFEREVSDAEAYRFLTEELMALEIEEVNIPGMFRVFSYEDFHPDDQKDARRCAKVFLSALLTGDRDTACCYVFEGEGSVEGGEEMKRKIGEFCGAMAVFMRSHANIVDCRVEGDEAHIEAEVRWSGFGREDHRWMMEAGKVEMVMSRSPAGGWDVSRARLPGGFALGS